MMSLSRVPIRLRVSAAFAIAMAVVLAATSWFLYARLDSHLAGALDRDLRLRAQDLGALVRDPSGSLAAAGGVRLIERGESYAQLIDSRGRVIDATRPLGRTPLLSGPELSLARRRAVFADRGAVPGLDEPSRLLATPVQAGGWRAVLVVGSTKGDRTETLASLRDELVIAGPVALALASLAGYLLAGLALRSVESMRRRAAVISAETPGERLPVPRTRDEIEQLATTLNDMLARLEEALQRERDFVADAGHELRTPLALLRTELELSLRHAESAEELREAIALASDEVERLIQLAEGLLLIARSDRGQLPLQLQPVDVSQLLTTIADRFRWRVEEAGRPLTIEAEPGLTVRADRLRIEQALGNLVDNALRHGGREIRLTAARADSSVELHVLDAGEGFPADVMDRAFERFTRSERARAGGGSGLGLSIVEAIAQAHGGSAHAANRDRDTDVWIVLPALRRPASDHRLRGSETEAARRA